ncbi:hypothetical protein [Vibrio parahaemolyticus]|uniref:hypothetical protein n=1 Tax=Vibrio parahaemolyticus TaxID=670 RepID=UPI0021A3C7DC|nr:hypothetical protein [Vibrio parahaemolyticus]
MKINIFKKLQVVFLVVSASLMVGCSSIDAHAGGGYGKPFLKAQGFGSALFFSDDLHRRRLV